MALTYSQMTPLGTAAPFFDLPTANPDIDGFDGPNRSLDQYAASPVLVVVFMCNHCPYVIHVREALIQLAADYQERGVQCVGISANDAIQYPSDSFEQMAKEAQQYGYPFPYLYDASQEVARSYGALCTPDFFIYNEDRTLVYRGRLDETRPGQGRAHGGDLRTALDQLMDTGAITAMQYPSMGCNIKWT